MRNLHRCQLFGSFPIARAVVATALLGSCSLGQAPCEPRDSQRTNDPKPSRSAPHAVDWTTMPSTFTHDETGQRVDRYAQGVEPEVYGQADFVRSGFTHTRSSLQVGFNSDHYHVTEQWGGQVRPYGEWRFPYRPFAVPYGAWGPQLPQVAVNGLGVPPWQNGPWQNGPWQNGPWQNGPWQNAPGQPVPGQPVPGQPGAGGMGQPGMPPGYGIPPSAPWWGPPYAPYGGVGPFGVGPGNALSPIQEDYYPQAPIYQQPSDGYFHSPYRAGP